jgi:hypothetical protein
MLRRFFYEVGRAARETGQAIDRIGETSRWFCGKEMLSPFTARERCSRASQTGSGRRNSAAAEIKHSAELAGIFLATFGGAEMERR